LAPAPEEARPPSDDPEATGPVNTDGGLGNSYV
jgi:hypothetical protein